MQPDVFRTCVDRGAHITAGVAITTDLCREAQRTHGLQTTSAIALGRLMTATALTGLIVGPRAISLQVVCEGRLGQIFADITERGELRGYVKDTTLRLPVIDGDGRRDLVETSQPEAPGHGLGTAWGRRKTHIGTYSSIKGTNLTKNQRVGRFPPATPTGGSFTSNRLLKTAFGSLLIWMETALLI